MPPRCSRPTGNFVRIQVRKAASRELGTDDLPESGKRGDRDNFFLATSIPDDAVGGPVAIDRYTTCQPGFHKDEIACAQRPARIDIDQTADRQPWGRAWIMDI